MTKEQLRKLSLLIDLEALRQAVEAGINIESREFNALVKNIKRVFARKNNISVAQLESLEKETEGRVEVLSKRMREMKERVARELEDKDNKINALAKEYQKEISRIEGLITQINYPEREEIESLVRREADRVRKEIPKVPDQTEIKRRIAQLEMGLGEPIYHKDLVAVEPDQHHAEKHDLESHTDGERVLRVEEAIEDLFEREETSEGAKYNIRGLGWAQEDWVKESFYTKDEVDALIGTGGTTIPQYENDPSSPEANDVWVRKSATTTAGMPQGLLLAITYSGGESGSYELSYRTEEGTTVRSNLS